jgi:hypothetical protein
MNKEAQIKIANQYYSLGAQVALEEAGLLKLANPKQKVNPQDYFKSKSPSSVTKKYSPSSTSKATSRKVDRKRTELAQGNLTRYLNDGLDHSKQYNPAGNSLLRAARPAMNVASSAVKAFKKKQLPLGGGLYAGKVKGVIDPYQENRMSNTSRMIQDTAATGRGLPSAYGLTLKGSF